MFKISHSNKSSAASKIWTSSTQIFFSTKSMLFLLPSLSLLYLGVIGMQTFLYSLKLHRIWLSKAEAIQFKMTNSCFPRWIVWNLCRNTSIHFSEIYRKLSEIVSHTQTKLSLTPSLHINDCYQDLVEVFLPLWMDKKCISEILEFLE